MGFHLLSSSPGFLPLVPSSSSSGVGIPGMEVKARARRDRCVWGIVRGRTRRCRGDDAFVSVCNTSGRKDDMVVQRQTTNLIKKATAAWKERVLSWTDETPGVKTHNGFCLANPRICLLLLCSANRIFECQALGQVRDPERKLCLLRKCSLSLEAKAARRCWRTSGCHIYAGRARD